MADSKEISILFIDGKAIAHSTDCRELIEKAYEIVGDIDDGRPYYSLRTCSLDDFGRMFVDCKKLGALKIPSSPKFASYSDWFDYMFWHCKIFSLDCSNWNVPASAEHAGFNGNAPGVILPKVWQ